MVLMFILLVLVGAFTVDLIFESTKGFLLFLVGVSLIGALIGSISKSL